MSPGAFEPLPPGRNLTERVTYGYSSLDIRYFRLPGAFEPLPPPGRDLTDLRLSETCDEVSVCVPVRYGTLVTVTGYCMFLW